MTFIFTLAVFLVFLQKKIAKMKILKPMKPIAPTEQLAPECSITAPKLCIEAHKKGGQCGPPHIFKNNRMPISYYPFFQTWCAMTMLHPEGEVSGKASARRPC